MQTQHTSLADPGRLLPQPLHRRARRHGRQRRAALDRARPARRHLRAAVDGRRLHARAGEPADARRLDGRPAGAQARLRGRPRRLLARRRCCAAWRRTSELLVAFRVLQAVGGSMLNPVAMSIITNTFTDPRERAQAVGIWGAVFGISMALGPIVGGTLVDAFGWRPIFWINLPVGLAAIALTLRLRPRVAGAAGAAVRPRRPGAGDRAAGGADLRDHRGARSCGWSSPVDRGRVRGVGGRARRPAGLRAAPRGAARSTCASSARRRSRRRSSISVAAFAAFGGFLFLNTLYLQARARLLAAARPGLATVPMALMTVVASPLSGRIVGRRGPRLPLVVAGRRAGRRVRAADRHRRRARRWRGCSSPTSSSGSASGWSTRRSPTPPSPGCRARRRAWRRRSPPPRARSARRSASRSPARSSPAHAGGAGLAAASHPAWWTLAACGGVVLVARARGAPRARARRVGAAHRRRSSTRRRSPHRLAGDAANGRRRARGLAADVRPRARQQAAARGRRRARHELRPLARAPPAGAAADVDARARRPRSASIRRTRPSWSTTSRPRASCAGAPHPTDRRAKVVEATRKGKELARRADAILATRRRRSARSAPRTSRRSGASFGSPGKPE